MKILYITNYKKTSQASGGFINDYLNDLLFYGLTELENIEVIDSTPIIHLYKENQQSIPLQTLWGKGFTSTYLIDKDNVDRSNIEEKIKDKYFDLIMYGSINRCLDYYDLVSKIYSPNKIFLIDGDDSTNINPLSSIHLYFKRELISDKFIPIHFAIPECKITTNKLDKTQEYGSIIPGQGGYKFDIEQEYYNDYNKSYFGVTMKKAGWDCMRHYEILANNCIPYFTDLEECPNLTLTNLPKGLLLEAKKLANNFEEQKYFDILNELFNYTKQHLTTKQLAQHVLNYV
jgi:hypothetical protein